MACFISSSLLHAARILSLFQDRSDIMILAVHGLDLFGSGLLEFHIINLYSRVGSTPSARTIHQSWPSPPPHSSPSWWVTLISTTRWQTQRGSIVPQSCQPPFPSFRALLTWASHSLIPPVSTQGFPWAGRPGHQLLTSHLPRPLLRPFF